jgi:hypothetical protein
LAAELAELKAASSTRSLEHEVVSKASEDLQREVDSLRGQLSSLVPKEQLQKAEEEAAQLRKKLADLAAAPPPVPAVDPAEKKALEKQIEKLKAEVRS